MSNDEVRIPRDVLVTLRYDIEAYKAGDPTDDDEWAAMLNHLDSIHEALDKLLNAEGDDLTTRVFDHILTDRAHMHCPMRAEVEAARS